MQKELLTAGLRDIGRIVRKDCHEYQKRNDKQLLQPFQ